MSNGALAYGMSAPLNAIAYLHKATETRGGGGRKVIYTTPATPITAVLARESVGPKREIRRNGAHFVMEYTTIAITFFSPTIGTCTDQQGVTLLLGNGPACAQAPNCLFMTMTAYNNYGHHCNRE